MTPSPLVFAAMNERVSVITGGTGGLGKAVTRAFLARGDSVVVTFVVPTEAEDLERSLQSDADRLTLLQADVTDDAGIRSTIAAAYERHGRIDSLVALVGGFAAGQPIWDTDDMRWERMLELNLRSSFMAVRAVAPRMIEAGYGRIVLASSRAARVVSENQAAYTVAKAAIIALVEASALELRAHGVTINCILPSIIDTPANRAAMPSIDPTKWVKPDEIASVVSFLASDAAGAVSGAAIPVYGRA